jgi:hypothetical protein
MGMFMNHKISELSSWYATLYEEIANKKEEIIALIFFGDLSPILSFL